MYNVYRYPKGYRLYSHLFDYFDYSGINRAVHLYTTPKVYVCNISVSTSFEKNSEGNILFRRYFFYLIQIYNIKPNFHTHNTYIFYI